MKILYIDKNNALQFHKDNMNSVNKIVFAKYFSPSCPACISMSKEWDDMCGDIKSKYNNTDLVIAQIDPSGMDELNNTSTYSEVDYVPSLVVLNRGKMVKQYEGSRQKDDMIKFLIAEGYLSNINMNGGKKRVKSKKIAKKSYKKGAKKSTKKTGKKSIKKAGKKSAKTAGKK